MPCQLKGAPHGGNFGGIPAANGLIESSRPIEHLVHILEVGRVPCADVLVELRCIIEHRGHVGDLGYVPVGEAVD